MPETRISFFADLEFIAGDVDPACRGVIERRRWPGYWTLQLFLPTRGRLDFRLGDGPWQRLTAPAFYWHHPAGRYSYRPVDGAWHHHWIAFRGERGQRLIEDGFMPLSVAGWCAAGAGRLAGERFSRLVGCLDRRERHGEAVILLESLLDQAQRASAPSAGSRIATLLARVADEPLAAWDFAAEAARLGITPAHLRRLWVAEAGRPPQAHLTRLRMQAAVRLLAAPAASVAAVARRCRLSPGRFSRQFHAIIGATARSQLHRREV